MNSAHRQQRALFYSPGGTIVNSVTIRGAPTRDGSLRLFLESVYIIDGHLYSSQAPKSLPHITSSDGTVAHFV